MRTALEQRLAGILTRSTQLQEANRVELREGVNSLAAMIGEPVDRLQGPQVR